MTEAEKARELEQHCMGIACAVVKSYGEGDEREQEAADNGKLWGDHPAYKAAVAAASLYADKALSLRGEVIEECASIAEAIDSGRGNEKEIAKAIRSLANQESGNG